MDGLTSEDSFGMVLSTSTAVTLALYNSSDAAGNVSSVNVTENKLPFPADNRASRLTKTDMVIIPVSSLIFILSVMGNLLVMITLIQNKRMRTVTNVFLLNLSISDLLLAVFCMPFTIIPLMLRNFIFGHTMCILKSYMQGVSVCVSCFTLVAISLERYFAICRPLHSRKWQTLSHSYKTIGFCWLLACILCIPMATFAIYKRLPMGNHICREDWSDPAGEKAYTIMLDFVLLVIPVLIMSVSYGKISYTLWIGMKMDKEEVEAQNGNSSLCKEQTRALTPSLKDGFGRSVGPSEMDDMSRNSSSRKQSSKLRFDTRGMRQSNSEKSRAAKKRVVKMLFAVVLEFFCCWTPLFILQTWMTIDGKHARTHIPQISLTISYLLAYVSSCCNPITYCFMNKNFRKGFLSVFRCCKCSKSIRNRQEMPSYYHYSTARTGISQISSYDKVKEDSDEL